MDHVRRYRANYGSKRRRHYGNGENVQDAFRTARAWGAADDRLVGGYAVLNDCVVGELSFKLNRTPSEIRTRHAYLLQQQARERHEAARRVAERLKNRPKSKTP